jgi:hypothetical protein
VNTKLAWNTEFITESQRLVFTKGITGRLAQGKIILIAGGEEIPTDFCSNIQGLQELERCFNIRYVGYYNTDGKSHFVNHPYNFRGICNGHFTDTVRIYYKIEDFISHVERHILTLMFGDLEDAYSKIRLAKPYIISFGIDEEFFCSKEDFEEAYKRDNRFTNDEKHKLIYYYDLVSLLMHFYNIFRNIEMRFFSVQIELSNIVNKLVAEKHNRFLDEIQINRFSEIWIQSWFADKIYSMYMDNIIGMRALLDLITKVAYEIVNPPPSFDRPVKMSSNGIYYGDCNRINNKKFNQILWDQTVFGKVKRYEELSYIRNEFVHNSSLSPYPRIYVGKGTSCVNNNEIFYACCFMWDIGNTGKPTRWVNRYRFYGNQTCIDEYILNWLVEIYIDVEKTIDLLEDYLCSLPGQQTTDSTVR